MHWDENDLDEDMEDLEPRSQKQGKKHKTKKHEHWPDEIRSEKEDRRKDRRLSERRQSREDEI